MTTKIWHTEYHDVEAALRNSLKLLQLEYVDLYLVHFPNGHLATPPVPMHVLWKTMEHVARLKLTKSIGVSNFTGQLLRDLLSYAEIRPVCNQIELNPQNQ